MRRPGRFRRQAAIVAVHAEAATVEATDWAQILALYDLLLRYDGSPVVRLNRAIALAVVTSPQQALAELDTLAPALDPYDLWHAARGAVASRWPARRGQGRR